MSKTIEVIIAGVASALAGGFLLGLCRSFLTRAIDQSDEAHEERLNQAQKVTEEKLKNLRDDVSNLYAKTNHHGEDISGLKRTIEGMKEICRLNHGNGRGNP